MNGYGGYQVPQNHASFPQYDQAFHPPILIVPQDHPIPYSYPPFSSGIDNFGAAVNLSLLSPTCPCPQSFNNCSETNNSRANVKEYVGKLKGGILSSLGTYRPTHSFQRVRRAKVRKPKAKRIHCLMRGKSDDSQLNMYAESLTPITDEVSSLLMPISLPSKSIESFCDACSLKRQIFSGLKSVLSVYDASSLKQMIGNSDSAKESRNSFTEAIDKGLSESLYSGIFKRSILRVRRFVLEAVRRILSKKRGLGDVEEFQVQIDIDKIVNNAIQRRLRWSASHFMEHSSTYKFEIPLDGGDIDSIIKARNIILKSEVVVLDFHSFYLIAPFWRHFFTKSSFKLRDVSGPGEEFKKECVCTMKCRYNRCPYSQRVFVNFEKQRVRIQKTSLDHTHTDEELIESSYLGYLCSYIKFFVPISTDFTASRMRMLIENAICPKAIENSSRLAALGFNSVPLSKFRGEILKVRKGTMKYEQEKATFETNVIEACRLVNNQFWGGGRDLSQTFFIYHDNLCLLLANRKFLKELVLEAQVIVMDSTFDVGGDSSSKLFSIVYRDKYFKTQVGAAALMRTNEPSSHIKAFLSALIRLASDAFTLPKDKLFRKLSSAIIDESRAEDRALHEVFNRKNGFNDIKTFTCVFHKEKNFRRHMKNFKGCEKVSSAMIATMYAQTEDEFNYHWSLASKLLDALQEQIEEKVEKKIKKRTVSNVSSNEKKKNFTDDYLQGQLELIRMAKFYLKGEENKKESWAMCYRHGCILTQMKSSQRVESIHNMYKNKVVGVGMQKSDNPMVITEKLLRFFRKREAIRDHIEELEQEGKGKHYFTNKGLPQLDTLPYGLYWLEVARYKSALKYFYRTRGKRKRGRPSKEDSLRLDASIESTNCKRGSTKSSDHFKHPCWHFIGFRLPCKHIFLAYIQKKDKNEDSNWFNQEYYMQSDLAKRGCLKYEEEFFTQEEEEREKLLVSDKRQQIETVSSPKIESKVPYRDYCAAAGDYSAFLHTFELSMNRKSVPNVLREKYFEMFKRQTAETEECIRVLSSYD